MIEKIPVSDSSGNAFADLLTGQMNNQHPVMKALLSDNQDLRIRLVLPRAIGQSVM